MGRRFKPVENVSLKDSLASLRFVPRFFKKIYTVSPTLFLANLLLRLVDATLPVAMLWVGKVIIDEVVLQINADVKSYDTLILYIGLEFGLAIFSDFLSRTTSLTDGLLGDKYSNYSSIELIKKTSEVTLDQLEDSAFYDKLERARQQTTSRVSLMSNILSQGQDVLIIISLLAGVVIFEPWLILLLILSVIPTIANELKFSGTSYSLARSWTQERRELDYLRYAGASDVTAKEVKLFGLSDYLSKRFEALSNQYFEANKKLALKRYIYGTAFNIMSTTAYYGAYGLIVFRTVMGVISLGDLTFLSGSFNRLRGKLQQFFVRFTYITESALYLQDYFEFLDIQPDSKLATSELLPLPKKPRIGFEFVDIGFKYPKSENWVVRNINFSIKAGEKIAFVGENGAGKTTLIKLLLRFYDPTEGKILLDGEDIKNYDRNEYQQYFGVIFQDFVKFELTLKENIAVGNIEQIGNEGEIKDAAEKSLANQVIEAVPKGLEQQLGRRFKNGKDLSGGQWQKIALARAYMKEAEVLVLDEPTSALDARAEYEAFQRFIALTKGKTAVIISHRFSTVRMADRIMVLKDGAVLEIGTHEALMAKGQLYAELFKLQAAGYQ
jgi:ATP-binding cassette subfamily B protein